MMKRFFPALLVSALIVATPALASPGSIAASRNGVPVQLRAEYVPASEFAAPPAAPAPPDDPGHDNLDPGTGDQDGLLAAAYAPTDDVPSASPAAYYQLAGHPQDFHGQAGYAPPLAGVHTRQVVPVAYAVPVAYGVPVGWRGNVWGRRAWNRGWYGGWNRGWGGRGWNGGWGGRGWSPGWSGGFGHGFNRGGFHRGGWACRSTGTGALVGSVAGAAVGYGVANSRDRGTGVVIGGIVGALAGTALERSNRC